MTPTIEPVDPTRLPSDATVRDYDELDESLQTEFARAVGAGKRRLAAAGTTGEFVKFDRYYRVSSRR